MLKEVIMDLKEKLNQYGIILSFSGPFSQGIIEEIGDALKSYLNQEEENTKGDVYKVFSVFIEQTQNVKNYASTFEDEEEREEILSSGVMILGKDGDQYFICSGNLIKKEDIDKLKNRLDQVISCDKKALAKLYRKRLREEMRSGSGGAGLGLMEMAKQANQKLDYSFIEQEGNYFFTLTVYI